MLADESISCIWFSLKEISVLKIFPITISQNVKYRIKHAKTSQALIALLFLIFDLICLKLLPVAVHLYIIVENIEDLSRISLSVLYTSGLVFSGIYIMIGRYLIDQIIVFVNSLFEVNQDLKKVLNHNVKADNFSKFSKLLILSTYSAAIFAYPIMLRRNAMENAYSYFGGKELIGKLGYASISCIIALFNWKTIQFYILTTIGYLNATKSWLSVIRQRVTNRSLKFNETLASYRKLQICNIYFREAYCIFFLPVLFLQALSYAIGSITTILLFHEKLPITSLFIDSMVAVLAICSTVYLADLAGKVDRFSEDLLNSTRKLAHGKYDVKYIKSMIPLNIGISHFFYCKSKTAIILVAIILDQIISFVILFKESDLADCGDES